jgi:hypothetical protein
LGTEDGSEGVCLGHEPGHTREARVELQKKTLGATERDEEKRSGFRERLKGVDASRLVFVDETSTNVALTPRYARAPRREGLREGAQELGQERHLDLFDQRGWDGSIHEHRGLI